MVRKQGETGDGEEEETAELENNGKRGQYLNKDV
jgi:hypothetical protein